MNITSVPSDVQEARLEQWLTEYGDAVLRICFLYLANKDLAEDAMQDTFIKVWRTMDKFENRNGSSPKTWITRIAINTCKDYKRSAWFRHVDIAKALEEIPPAFYPTTRESREVFLDVLHLPAKHKQAILLYYYQNMTLEETAEVLGISRPTLNRRLKKAYALLRYQPEGREV